MTTRARKRLAIAAALLALIVSAPLSAETLERPDGSAIDFHILSRTGQQQGIVLMLQGSGCEPVIEREWLHSEPAILAPSRAVLAIEKYGVDPQEQNQSNFVDGCTPDYWNNNTLQQRVLDAVQVIARLRQEAWWNRELVIHGGSEGGAVAAMLAPLVPEVRAVIIVSSGIGVSVAELIASAVPPPIAAEIPAMIEEAKANPVGTRRFGGASYRWWAQSADIVPAKALLQTPAPVLLIQGSKDQFAPAASARAARDLLIAADKSNLTYREYDGYDHFMVDEAGVDHGNEVARFIAGWLAEQ